MLMLPERCELLQVPNYTPGDPYSVLGLESGCTKREVWKAFRRIAKKYHADLLPDNLPGGTVESCKHFFSDAYDAKELLLDDQKRMMFDRFGFTGVKFSIPHNILVSAKEMLSSMYNNLCNNLNQHQAKTTDVMAHLTKMVSLEKKFNEEEAQKIAKQIGHYEYMIRKTRSKSYTFMTKLASANLNALKLNRQSKCGKLMTCDKAAQLIKEYEYDFEKAELNFSQLISPNATTMNPVTQQRWF